ncbi:MAG: DUF362 domain-containing protein [Bryobacteraceae bacterium]
MASSRRQFLAFTAGTGAVASAQQNPPQRAQGRGGEPDPRMAAGNVEKLFRYSPQRSTVSLIKGDNRRKNIYESLLAIDDQIRPGLSRKKYVLIKPNGLDPSRQVGTTHPDAIHGILDYLAPRFKGPVVLADCANVPSKRAYDEYGWASIAAQHKPLDLSVAVVNESPRHELAMGIDFDLHLIPIQLAAQALDPDAYLISCSVMKNHNMVVATLSVKNVVVGMTLTPPPGVRAAFAQNDRRKYHVGIRQGNYNLYVATKRMMGNWGLGVIDGYEGMEGNGPWSGTPVAHRIALASTDFLAADRVGVECMGIDAGWPGYLNYCYQDGLGQWDLSKIDVVGAKIADVRIKYRHHADVDRMLQWQGPMLDLPPNLGRRRAPLEEDLAQYA